MKLCTRCDQEKNLSDFYGNVAQKDGLSSWCRACHKAYLKVPRPLADDASERFWAQTTIGESGCILWTGYRDRNGYGRFTCGTTKMWAHRFAYLDAFSVIPEGLELDHLCRTRLCVNPVHLEVVTHQENGIRKPTTSSSLYCKRNHRRTAENTYHDKRGGTMCRLCALERSRVNHAKRRLARLTQKEPA